MNVLTPEQREVVPDGERARKRCDRCFEIKRNCIREFGYRRKGKGWSTTGVCSACRSGAMVQSRRDHEARLAAIKKAAGG